jgi:hypothetical protein
VSERTRLLSRGELFVPALVVFLLALPVFARLCAADPNSLLTDHPFHTRIALELAAGGEIPPNPLYHFCLFFLSFGNNPAAATGVAAALLALALAARAYLSAVLFTSRADLPLGLLVTACLALAVAMPLPNWWDFPTVGRGQVSPNVWHNPTAIFAMPFALLLFLLALRMLDDPRLPAAAAAGGATVLSVLAKPNYVLAFAPCLVVAALVALARAVRNGRLSVFGAAVRLLAAFGPALAVLGYQFQSTFGRGGSGAAGVIFDPLAVWRMTSPNVPASVLLGVVFPLVVTAFYPRQAVRDPGVVLGWATLAVAVAQFALLFETGSRAFHGNFGWGVVLADQVLFVACGGLLLRQPVGVFRDLAFLVLGLHVASGGLCLVRCLISPDRAGTF